MVTVSRNWVGDRVPRYQTKVDWVCDSCGCPLYPEQERLNRPFTYKGKDYCVYCLVEELENDGVIDEIRE